MTQPSSGTVLQFEQLQSAVSPEFWAALGAAKLDEWKLSEEPREIYGFLSPSSHEGIPAALLLNDRSLPPAARDSMQKGDDDDDEKSFPFHLWPPPPPSGATAVPGTLLLVNSKERFLGLDRKVALAREAEKVWRSAVASAVAATGGRNGDTESDDGEPDDSTPELARFLLIAHADLKTYRYTYWFAFPALKPRTPFLCRSLCDAAAASATATTATEEEKEAAAGAGAGAAAPAAAQARPLASALGASAAEAVAAACDEYRKTERKGQRRGPPLAWAVELTKEEGGGGDKATCFPLRRLWSSESSSSSSSGSSSLFLAFADPGADLRHPGWTLRNALFAVAAAAKAAAGEIRGGNDDSSGDGGEEKKKPNLLLPLLLRCVCVRLRRGVVSPSASLALDVDLESAGIGIGTAGGGGEEEGAAAPGETPPEATGWEPNARGRPGPRSVDLSSALDPARLATDALALNLRLMRWRAAPALDPGVVSKSKFLLLGAGTLGCSVARTLLGWGVTEITFVDSGVVSYSNPPRQSLFEHADCFGGGGGGEGEGEGGIRSGGGSGSGSGGGKPKAAAAAAALRRVYPGCRARGVRLSIPMPGHPLSGSLGSSSSSNGESPSNDGTDDLSRVSAVVAELDSLVRECDVALLLTDTREARWLPTLLCAAHSKICITAALGFDSYVVMRHGGPPREEEEKVGDEEKDDDRDDDDDEESRRQRRRKQSRKLNNRRRRRLGCYFCSDVVAPTDSTRDRSLDQQCTVSRPGCAPLAGAIAAELAAAVLAHPLGVEAPPPRAERSGPASGSSEDSDGAELDLPLGEAAHMVRGRLGAAFAQRAMVAEAFDGCTACSRRAVAAYRSRGAAFVLDALRDPRSLEALTGLDELHASAGAMVASSSEEEEEEEGEEGQGKEEDDEWTEL